MARARRSVFLVVDTCVWLDLAKDPNQEGLIAALEELVRTGVVNLVTPKIVADEFERNKDRVIEESGRSIAGTLRRMRELLQRFGEQGAKDEAIRQLNEIDQKSVNYRDAAAEAVRRLDILIYGHSEFVAITPEHKLAAAERAIQNLAPFHRQRNSVGDALLIEAYGEIQKRRQGHYAFVTHNIKDFSNIGANELEPHPDIAKYFPKTRSRYFTKLGDALNAYRPDEFRDIMVEQTWYFPPRRHAEINDAIVKLRDQVWYNRHQVWNEKLQRGEVKLIEDNEERGKDPLKRDGVNLNRFGIPKSACF